MNYKISRQINKTLSLLLWKKKLQSEKNDSWISMFSEENIFISKRKKMKDFYVVHIHH